MSQDPWLWTALGLAAVLLMTISLFSSLETAVLNARRSRLTQWATSRRTAAAEAVLEAPDQFQSSAHLAKSLCEALLYAAVAVVGLHIALQRGAGPFSRSLPELLSEAWPGVVLGALIAYLAVTLLGEAIPKSLATRQPERTLLRWAAFIRLFTLIFSPMHWIARRLGRGFAALTGADLVSASRAVHSEEEIKLLVEGSAEEGVLEEEEKEMIHSIIEFTDTVARQVMVPRIDIHSVNREATLDEVLQAAMESGHSRLPVYEGTLDNVVGVVHVKDLIPRLVSGDRHVPISTVMRPPFFVPEAKKLDELLREFRAHKSQLAVVVDEYGGTSGLVTMEDVIEEIVGEIQDEYDQEEHPEAKVTVGGEGTLVDARMPLTDLNEQLGLKLPMTDFDTLGGFVFSLFGRPPEVGERVAYESQEFIVEALEGLRLQKIRVVVRSTAPPTPEPAPS